MLRDLDPTRPQVILELGSGTGPLTEMISRRMHPESTFLSVEVDKELYEIAAARCPNTDIAHASVEFLPDLLADRNLDQVDLFLSCLPTPSLPQPINKVVFETWKRMSTNGVFTQITQIPWWFMPLYKRAFRTVTMDLVMLNPPPGGVYHCSDLYEDFDSAVRLPGKAAA
ncbi:MAG: hypothetical protein CMJ39_08735 [Phycisphaerae bacterium]|nr:hypothetical protein [Phycisphaerae bacterium]